MQPALEAMARHGLRFDALLKPRHLPVIGELAQRHPDLSVVIDHAAKPDIANGHFQPWASHMARLARDTPWCCKVSGLVTEARADWQIDDLRPYVDHLLATFGPDRLMWGSDWPVVTLASNYRRWRETAATLLPADTHDAVFGGTASDSTACSDLRSSIVGGDGVSGGFELDAITFPSAILFVRTASASHTALN